MLNLFPKTRGWTIASATMQRGGSTILLLTLFALPIAAHAQATFTDDFSSYAEGSDASPRWKPVAGKWVVQGGQYVQSAADYDRAATADVRPTGKFTYSIRTKATGGFVGGGLFFNMRNREHVADSQMARVDPEGVMWGPINATRTFQFGGMHNQRLSRNTWYTLAVAVDPELGKYNVLLDGKVVGKNLDLRYFDGGIGLQSSGGANAFDDVTVRPATAEELAGLEIKRPFNAPQDVAIGPLERLYVAHRGKNTVAVVSTGDPWSAMPVPFGRVIAEFAPRGKGDDRVMDPVAIDFSRTAGGFLEDVLVLDRIQNAVKVYAQDGTFRRAFSTFPATSPSDMAVAPSGDIVVVSPDANTVAVFRPNGEQVGNTSSGLKSPQGVTVDRAGRILVADTENQEIDLFTVGADGQVQPAGTIPGWLKPRALAVTPKNQIAHFGALGYYESGGAVRLIDQHGRRIGHFAGFAIGGLGGNGSLAVSDNGTIYLVDTDKDRIVVVPPDLNEPRPHVEVTGDRATITWVAPSHGDWLRSTTEPAFTFRYGTSKDPATWTSENTRTLATPAGAKPAEGGGPGEALPVGRPTAYRVAVTGLAPNTTYYYQFGPTLRTLPAGTDTNPEDAGVFPLMSAGPPLATGSKTYSFLSAPPKGQMPYVNVKAVAAIYLKTDDKGKRFSMPRADVGDRIPRMMERGRAFYWRNTHFKFHQEIDYVIIEDAEADIQERIPPVEQVRKDIQAARDFQGKNIEDYDSVFAIWTGQRYRKDVPEEVGEVHGPGLTPYGYSAFSAEDTVAWLNVHEYNHQVDAFFDRAGYPEFWLNHPDYTIHPGRYGGQYDVNAFIFREWPVNDWFWLPANDVGSVRLTPDADGDGVPDHDARLPFDEARLGSSTVTKDTDRDGLDDLGEAMAGLFRGTDPKKADTDGDGSIDSRDPWPLDAAVQDRARKTPTLDGVIMPGEWDILAPVAGRYTGQTYLNWDENAVYLAAVLNQPARLDIQLDPQNNGIFPGENIEMTVDATEPTAIAQDAPIRNGKGSYGVVREVNGKTVVEIAMPRNPEIGLTPQMYQTMGLSIQVYDFTTGQERWMSVFEPWRLWQFHLMNPNLASPTPGK